MARLRAAVIGLGRMGNTFDDEIRYEVARGGVFFLPYCHGPSFAASHQTDLVAGADPHEGQRAAFGSRFGLADSQLYADHRDMLAAERIDIVSVCTSARYRAQIVQDCAEAGVKAIWAEKPIAFTLEEADAMVQSCADHGVVMAVNCSRRWHPLFHEAHKMMQAGDLGEMLQVTGYGTCPLSSNGSHLIDTMCFLADSKVDWLFGELNETDAATADEDLQGNAYLAFANGLRGYMRGMNCGAASWDFEAIGTEGRIRSSAHGLDFELYRLVPGGIRGAGMPVKYPYPWPVSIEGMGEIIISDLIHCIETGDSPRCSGDDARHALEVAFGIHASHRSGGQRINLPLDERSQRILASESVHDHTPARFRRKAMFQQASR